METEEKKERVQSLIEDLKKGCANFVEERQQVIPMGFVLTEGAIAMIEVNDIFNHDKNLYKPIITALLKMSNAFAYILVDEIFLTASKRPLNEDISISELPPDDRSDHVMLSVVINGEDPYMLLAPINNRPEAQTIGEWFEMEARGESRIVIQSW